MVVMSDYTDFFVKGWAKAEERISNCKEAEAKAEKQINDFDSQLRGSGIITDGMKVEKHRRAVSITSTSPTKHHLIVRAGSGQLTLLKVKNADNEEEIIGSCLIENDEESKKDFFVKVGENVKYLDQGDEWF